MTALDGGDLVATAVEGSDAWRLTSDGFVHEDEHALLAPTLDVEAGPDLCAPTRAGLAARFHGWRITPPDGSLH